MDILIPDSWLRKFIKTNASPEQIGKYLSLCGPSVEKIEKIDSDYIYHIEITTNRIDSANVLGIAREIAAILPRFGIKATLTKPSLKSKYNFSKNVGYLKTKIDPNLCPRFTACLIRNVIIKKSPDWMSNLLNKVGVRSLNNIVDISNFIMHEIGQPVHTFDYDKIKGAFMLLRKSIKGEKIVTLDGETNILPGNDIIIEDGEKRLIDLAGIMGGELSCVDWNTKNVLLFVQTYNPANIRKTSMSLSKRTEAAVLFEKKIDTELVTNGIILGIELFKKITHGIPDSQILDIYPNAPKHKVVTTDLQFIEKMVGTKISKKEISEILSALEFKPIWINNILEVKVPSFRLSDISIPEDIVEEIARIYGYFRLPSILMQGQLPKITANFDFKYEIKIKETLIGLGGNEIYTYSLVTKEWAGKNSLRIRNPLGKETECLRTSLLPSLIDSADKNQFEKKPFHLFEMSNVYSPRKENLPEEKLMLSGIFSNYDFREAKGIIETFLERSGINYQFEQVDLKDFQPSHSLIIKSNNKNIGIFGTYELKNYIYYEFDVSLMKLLYQPYPTFKPIPKYPSQIEDISLILPLKTKAGDVMNVINNSDKSIKNTELISIYDDSYTYRVWYQDENRTLSNQDVKLIREKMLSIIKKKFGAVLKN